jgi:hypothetical protein
VLDACSCRYACGPPGSLSRNREQNQQVSGQVQLSQLASLSKRKRIGRFGALQLLIIEEVSSELCGSRVVDKVSRDIDCAPHGSRAFAAANIHRGATGGSHLRRACLVAEKTSAIAEAMSGGGASLFAAAGGLLSLLGPPLLHHIRYTLSALRGEVATLLGWWSSNIGSRGCFPGSWG